MTAPLLSIVTINLNNRDGLARTLASVAEQRLADRELIVVDGLSRDGSAELVRGQPDGLVTHFVCEKDGGIYDAQNKGLALARGSYCLFLNSGDFLLGPDVLARLLAGPPSEDLIYGDALIEEPWGERRRWEMPDRITLRWLMRSTLAHPAVAIRRSLFDVVGRYDSSLRICGDYRFFLDALVNHACTARRVPGAVAEQAAGGVSTSPGNRRLVAEERVRVQAAVLSPILLAHLEEERRAEARRPAALLRAALRPLARTLRGLGRRARGRPA